MKNSKNTIESMWRRSKSKTRVSCEFQSDCNICILKQYQAEWANQYRKNAQEEMHPDKTKCWKILYYAIRKKRIKKLLELIKD